MIVGLLMFAMTQVALSQTIPELTSSLSVKSYSKKIEVIKKLTVTGDPVARTLLQGLLDGALFVRKSDKLTVLATKEEKIYALINPLTGQKIGHAKKSELKKIRINNKVRGILKAGLGRLDLSHVDPDYRIQAARAIFKSSEKDMLEPLSRLIKEEENEKVKQAFVRAASALSLRYREEITTRVEAIATLVEFGDPGVKSLLSELERKLSKQSSLDEEEKHLHASIVEALETIDRRLEAYGFVENIFQGLSLGSVLLLAAIGLAITFGVMGVINMAHGEMVMIGAYTTYVIQEICRNYVPGLFDYSLILAIPCAFIVAGAVGVLIERGVIRFLYGRPLETLLATWGISLLLQQLVRTIFGPTNKEVGAPSWLSGAWEVTGGLSLTYNRIAIIFFSIAVLAALMLVLKKTLFGLQMRAVTQNRQMARSMGIKSSRIDAMTFGLGSGVAGMAGVALSQIDNVSPNLGQAYIIDSFMVVVFGGVGNLWGTLVGAGSLGIVNKFLEPYSGAVLAKILVLVAIILFIQKRPRGLFALKGRSVEG